MMGGNLLSYASSSELVMDPSVFSLSSVIATCDVCVSFYCDYVLVSIVERGSSLEKRAYKIGEGAYTVEAIGLQLRVNADVDMQLIRVHVPVMTAASLMSRTEDGSEVLVRFMLENEALLDRVLREFQRAEDVEALVRLMLANDALLKLSLRRQPGCAALAALDAACENLTKVEHVL